MPLARFILSCLAPLLSLSAMDVSQDCLGQPVGGDRVAFFVCLNVRREGCEELLRKVQAECGEDSAKYKITFERYLGTRGRANLLIDTVASDLRQGRRVKGDAYGRAMLDVSDAVRELEGSDKGLTCEGTPTRLLEALIPLITPMLSEKVQELVKGWLSGRKEERQARVDELTAQRWKLPSDLEVPFPGKPGRAVKKAKEANEEK